MNKTRNPQHRDHGRSIGLMGDKTIPPFVAVIDLSHQGVVNSYNLLGIKCCIDKSSCFNFVFIYQRNESHQSMLGQIKIHGNRAKLKESTPVAPFTNMV